MGLIPCTPTNSDVVQLVEHPIIWFMTIRKVDDSKSSIATNEKAGHVASCPDVRIVDIHVKFIIYVIGWVFPDKVKKTIMHNCLSKLMVKPNSEVRILSFSQLRD